MTGILHCAGVARPGNNPIKPKLCTGAVASLLIGVCIGFPIGRLTAPETTVPTIIPATGPADLPCPVVRVIGENAVRLEFEQPGTPERGSYGRLLAYLYVAGRNL